MGSSPTRSTMKIQVIYNNKWIDKNYIFDSTENLLEKLLSIHVSVKLEDIIFISDKDLSITKYMYKLRNY